MHLEKDADVRLLLDNTTTENCKYATLFKKSILSLNEANITAGSRDASRFLFFPPKKHRGSWNESYPDTTKVIMIYSVTVYLMLQRVTNPHEANIGGRTFLGTSGQPLKDMERYTTADTADEGKGLKGRCEASMAFLRRPD